jgi:hypothetical protein
MAGMILADHEGVPHDEIVAQNFTTDDLIDSLEDFLDDKPVNTTIPLPDTTELPPEEELPDEGEGDEGEDVDEGGLPPICGFLDDGLSIDYRRGGINWCDECLNTEV